ncbi:hypothetical protein [Granulicella arctica]|uniref:hypothetical protein n=1 Tax=Granulicella arctica TaxID=940613 RepID=UPI0021E0F4B2|nr:hypothetical protein [Granulicella arctica]
MFTTSAAGDGLKVQTKLTTAKTVSQGCGETTWGLPKPTSNSTPPEIVALVATVTDPLHGHMELDFDRSIDSIVQAAASYKYLPSYYWLPWNAKATQAGTTPDVDGARLRQPGLVIFKYSPEIGDKELSLSYHRLVYLFLVSETSTLGVNGTQLEAAFRAQRSLREEGENRCATRDGGGRCLPMPRATVRFTMKNGGNAAAIIGPRGSGSAASLRFGIEQAGKILGVDSIDVTGWTSTPVASSLIGGMHAKADSGEAPIGPKVTYRSFGENAIRENCAFRASLERAKYSFKRTAFLAEEGTVFGASQAQNSASSGATSCADESGLVATYPRGVALLRNASLEGESTGSKEGGSLSPYLPLTLKDAGEGDTIPQFSTSQTPISQESRLLALARDFNELQIQFVVISASNILDEFFLAEFFHRACPDAQLVFLNGEDLMFDRPADRPPFIGAVSLTPYPLAWTTHDTNTTVLHAFPDSLSHSIYNAASYTFWDGNTGNLPNLVGYKAPDEAKNAFRPSLWATAAGRDGDYLLGVLNVCGNESMPPLLPTIYSAGAKPSPCLQPGQDVLSDQVVNPSLPWFALCLGLTIACCGHVIVMLTARYWSSMTRDLDVRENDHPRRRSVYLHIGTAMLFVMTFLLAFPVFGTRYHGGTVTTDAFFVALLTMGAGLSALVCTLTKTWSYVFRSGEGLDRYVFFDLVAFLTTVFAPFTWARVCLDNGAANERTFAGVFFSYRSLHPESGVSPVMPVLILLSSWYLWAVYQTLRLRFSKKSRPVLPRAAKVTYQTTSPMYVSDEALDSFNNKNSPQLYKNMSCLLITRFLLQNALRGPSGEMRRWVDVALSSFYILLFCVGVVIVPFKSMDRFLWHSGEMARFLPTLYEFLIFALFFPQILIALSGWVRMLVVWQALQRGLLDPLEIMPLRDAFDRLKGVSWITMLRRGNLQDYWRDMSRSTESLRQLIHTGELVTVIGQEDPTAAKRLQDAYANLQTHVGLLMEQYGRKDSVDQEQPMVEGCADFIDHVDVPRDGDRRSMDLMWAIECDYAAASEALLSGILLPYWDKQRTGLVETNEATQETGSKNSGFTPLIVSLRGKTEIAQADVGEVASRLFDAQLVATEAQKVNPGKDAHAYIPQAEEFLALRYLSTIRSVLVNMRHIMSFVSITFVLGIVAWNSYPFQPRREVNWMFTALLLLLGIGVISVFAQMHRNAVLSRITDTKQNELGVEFFQRILTFGALPVLTWLAYQFPSIGGALFRMLQPSLSSIK